MMIAGLDLSALESRASGIALGKENNVIVAKELYRNEEIINLIISNEVRLCGVDAPLTLNENREADRLLRKYGGMSLKLYGIRKLAERALILKKILEDNGVRVLEVFPTATAKILGIYSKKKIEMLPRLHELLKISSIERVSSHVVDAILAYYTAYMFTRGEYYLLGGEIVLPSSNISNR